MTKEIEVCPHCDSALIWKNNPKPYGAEQEDQYHCSTCKRSFAEPDTRERMTTHGHQRTNSPAANALLDADPDEVDL